MSIDLYMSPIGGGGRSILMTAYALGLEVNVKYVDPSKGETLSPEFIKINSQHTVPTLVDKDGFSIWETRVICTYLINRYGKDDTLYPEDPKQRAIVDQRLFFDLSVLTPRLMETYLPLYRGVGSIEQEKLDKLKDAVGHLNTFLNNQKYAAGNNLTVADLVIINTVSTLEVLGFDFTDFVNVIQWKTVIEKEAVGYKEANEVYLEKVKNHISSHKQAS